MFTQSLKPGELNSPYIMGEHKGKICELHYLEEGRQQSSTCVTLSSDAAGSKSYG